MSASSNDETLASVQRRTLPKRVTVQKRKKSVRSVVAATTSANKVVVKTPMKRTRRTAAEMVEVKAEKAAKAKEREVAKAAKLKVVMNKAEKSLVSPTKKTPTQRFYNAKNNSGFKEPQPVIPKFTESQISVLNTKSVLNNKYNKEVNNLLRTRIEREGNVYYNASNKSFQVNNKLNLALRKNNPNILLKQLTPLPGVDVKKMESETKKVAKRIANFVKSGDFRNAMQTTGSLFAIFYLLKVNPRFMNNYLDVPLKYPIVKSVGRIIPSEKVGLFKQYFGRNLSQYFSYLTASATTSQAIYESLLSTSTSNAYGRSITGQASQYLAMVILALIAYLPYEKETKFCRNYLSYILKVLKMLYPHIERLVMTVITERVKTTGRRSEKLGKGLGTVGSIVYKALR
tara:strand:- start:1503 stop:2705 length:1203 start_codon:yes stop_codon:yes gene_type:complete